MKEFRLMLALSVLFLMPSSFLFAQHNHGSMGGGMGTGMGSGSMPDMHRMMAIQASEEQAGQFRNWQQSTRAARTFAQQLPQATVVAAPELQKAIAAASQGQQVFLSSLTAEQTKGLKKQIQNLEKEQTAVEKQLQAWNDAASRGDKRSIEQGKKLEKTLARWQNAQHDIASEMGIQG